MNKKRVIRGLAFSLSLLCAPVMAEITSTVVDELGEASYAERKVVLDAANMAATKKGLTLEALGSSCNLMPIRVGAILSGQAPLELATQECLETQLGLKSKTLAPLAEPPVRWNAGAIYRLHEAVDVYAPAIQRWMNERYGDTIMSAIDFVVEVKETTGSHGERRIQIIFDGKALPYSKDEGWRPVGGTSGH